MVQSPPETVHLVINTRAGDRRARRAAALEQAIFRSVSRHCPQSRLTRLEAGSGDEARAVVRRAVVDGAERVLIAGGDGSLHAVIPALVGTDTSLGIIPVGTGNDFATGLGLPEKLDDATRLAVGGSATVGEVDLLQVGDELVATVATAGFSARVNYRANRLRWPRGSLKYTAATLLEIMRMRTERVQISIEDQPPVERDVVMIAVANTSMFGGGMRIAPLADATDALMDVTMVNKVSPMKLLRLLPTVFKGTHVRFDEVETLRCTKIRVSRSEEISDSSYQFWGDGEQVTGDPATIQVLAGQLLVAGVGGLR